jgi:hypothetical protein
MTPGKQVIPSIGPVGRQVVANVEALRRERGYSFSALSDRLAAIGRPILPTVLHRLSQGGRRVDVDDLTALATVLGTTATRLLGQTSCPGCLDAPPAGFTCNACGAVGAVAS